MAESGGMYSGLGASVVLSYFEGVQGRNARRANGEPSEETETDAEGEPMDEQ